MDSYRKIKQIIHSQKVTDGAGVSINRIFGFNEEGVFDPFLLMDFFGSDRPEEFESGFPFHPHRGMETITYLMEGQVEHADSLGNKGMIESGDVQWMTAGSGIIHQEMPKSDTGRMFGFQLWSNLPRKHKMMPPRYQDIKSKDIPTVDIDDVATVRVIAGNFLKTHGAVRDIVSDPIYFDVMVRPDSEIEFDVTPGYTVFSYVYEGEGYFSEEKDQLIKKGEGALFYDGNKLIAKTDNNEMRFILISGKPLNEPVAWRGPIVMNSAEELQTAFKELQNGTFVK